MAASVKSGAKILVIGHNKIGKSRLINKFIGKDEAIVGDSVQPTDHELTKEIEFKTMTIYDTRGFGDRGTKDRSIVEAAITKMKEANVILICHKLYGSVDRNSETLLNELVRGLGNDLMEHAIFVFTFGDEYLIRCEEPNDDPEAIKAHMKTQESEVKKLLKQILLDNGIKEEIVDDIPSIITCGKKTELPTSEDWVDELRGLCEKRCKPEAGEFIGWWRRYLKGIAVGAAVVGVVVASTAVVGDVTGVNKIVYEKIQQVICTSDPSVPTDQPNIQQASGTNIVVAAVTATYGIYKALRKQKES